jgi:hypothetical protein
MRVRRVSCQSQFLEGWERQNECKEVLREESICGIYWISKHFVHDLSRAAHATWMVPILLLQNLKRERNAVSAGMMDK